MTAVSGSSLKDLMARTPIVRRGYYGRTLLHYIVRHEDLAKVRWMLHDKQENIIYKVKDCFGVSVLQYAIKEEMRKEPEIQKIKEIQAEAIICRFALTYYPEMMKNKRFQSKAAYRVVSAVQRVIAVKRLCASLHIKNGSAAGLLCWRY